MLTFAIKMQYGMVHNWKKKDESISNLKEFGKFLNHSKIITITKRAVILACSGKKENVCVYACSWERVGSGYVCVFYVEFIYEKCHSIWSHWLVFSRVTPSTG